MVYLSAMPQTSQYIKSLQDHELAFLKKYKLKTYLKTTQELILKEIFNRGLQDYELRKMIQEIEFNPANTGCPRCNSQKIRTDTVDISRGNRGGGFSIGVYFVIYQIDKIKHSEKFVVQH